MTLRFTPAAREDLRALRDYLSGEFGAEVAARTLAQIVANLSNLKSFPGLMGNLSDKIRRPTEYKYYFCGKLSVAILAHEADALSVVRILDMRSDYAALVFRE